MLNFLFKQMHVAPIIRWRYTLGDMEISPDTKQVTCLRDNIYKNMVISKNPLVISEGKNEVELSVRIDKGKNAYIGLASCLYPNKVFGDEYGYCISQVNGNIHPGCLWYLGRHISEGDIVTVRLNKAGEISFEVVGWDLGVAFEKTQDEVLYLCVELQKKGDKVTIL